jgi:hypothetical protein
MQIIIYFQDGRVGIPLTSLTLPHLCAFLKPRPGFPTSYILVFFMFNEFKGEVVLLILVKLLTITVEISFHNMIKNVEGLNWLMEFQPFRLENWISNDITRIKKLSKT